jgi:hypothetical protein
MGSILVKNNENLLKKQYSLYFFLNLLTAMHLDVRISHTKLSARWLPETYTELYPHTTPKTHIQDSCSRVYNFSFITHVFKLILKL